MFRKPKTPVVPVSSADVEHEQLTSLINSMADGVIAIDQAMHVVFYNGAALNVLDVNSSIHDKKLGSILKPIDKNKQPVDIEKMVQDIKVPTTTRDLLLPYGDGSTINLYLSIAPVHLGYHTNGTGKSGYILMLRDITREKSLEEERDEFISVVSHELRTPIAISEGDISNAQFIAERTGDLEQIKQALKEAHDQVLFLASMINDLATLSRAERGKLNVEVEPIDVAPFVQELIQNYAPNAKEKGLELKTNIAKDAGVLKSSKLYTQEILQNFITNAIKYTEQGSVTIGAKSAVQGDPGIIFTVSDTGIGISKSDQEKIFDKFFRSEDYRTRKNSGTGLGLYVTMKLAHLLHADITVRSELNKGSTFSIFIPNLS
ncbi:MAG TPA: PAS domain-containing sensor histidine kinase [Candidatus Saccharimonadales bacterium]|jgi:two-component system sensor histidine kinase ResE|nr:PAS domain-containing sensor histidine kinase [Candidatus Saccharimonadales bacterium]